MIPAHINIKYDILPSDDDLTSSNNKTKQMTWFLMNMVSGSIDREIDVYFATNYMYMYNKINSNLNEQENSIDWLRIPI